MTGRAWPVSMMADFELLREIEDGGEDSAHAADELAARREGRQRLRGIDPQAAPIAHHSGQGRPGPGPGEAAWLPAGSRAPGVPGSAGRP
jgi:hypothetical protein